MFRLTEETLEQKMYSVQENFAKIADKTKSALDKNIRTFELLSANFDHANPDAILRRGYAILRDADGGIFRENFAQPKIGDKIIVENLKFVIESEVKNVREK
jgi:exonuclease VII large subunit